MTREKAQSRLAAFRGIPLPGYAISDTMGGAIGVIATSIQEDTLQERLTYRRNIDSIVWVGPLRAGRVPPGKRVHLPNSAAAKITWKRLKDAPQRGQIYRHYKGGLYTVVAVGLEVYDLVPMITYVSNETGFYWTRTLENFTSYVPGVEGPVSRFGRVHG